MSQADETHLRILIEQMQRQGKTEGEITAAVREAATGRTATFRAG